MANIAFSKLGCKINTEKTNIEWNSQNIEVAHYLPIQEKLRLMGNVISQSFSEVNYANPVQVNVYTAIAVVQNYTNIKFSEKQLEDIPKLYDMIVSTGLYDDIVNAIPAEEFEELVDGIQESLTAFYAYRTSVLGILDALKTDYSDLNLDLSTIMDQIKDPEALKLVKEIAPLLGANQDNPTP